MKIISLSRSCGVRCIDSSGRWSLHCWRGNLRRPVRDVQGCSATSLALIREASRQVNELAEGQNCADVKRRFTPPPPLKRPRPCHVRGHGGEGGVEVPRVKRS